ncbi:type IV pilus assembly protein PilM [Streptococcus gallinaceus]|uniref:pilus assembly protein PilM n=2 Tax=Streptococcus gallinaceus TaxID=165758 RepID=UPI0020A464FD|nr:pilus assembly protein PilM [Streptococcus gallinaceus]MCP1638538.1 type IV pilus assembly protein PilM [Streptococcus gallinaceus]MCP1769375.1 type IV pilus assembly protein PilM [Streptococcus gallinaceus]
MGRSMFSVKKKKETGHMSDNGSGKSSLLTRLNQPLFKKKEELADEEYMLDSELQVSQAASTKNKSITSLFSTKKGKGGKNAGQPYTMFSKPIKGNLLAIDFDDYDLTLVVAKQKRKELEIVKTVKASLPAGLVHDGLIINMDALIEFIDHLMKENDVVAKYAFFAVNNTGVIARPVMVPDAVAEEDIENFISFELQQYLDIDTSSYIIDYQFSPQADGMIEEGSKSLIAYAVPKATVEQHYDLADALHLVPYVFDLRSNTYEKWLERVEAINNRGKYLTEGNIGIVQLGKHSIDVYLYANGRFVTSNHMDHGYHEIEDLVDTELTMRHFHEIVAGNMTDLSLKRVLDEWLNETKMHIINTERFFSSTTGETIDKFYSIGEGALCWHLISVLKTKFDGDIEAVGSVDSEDIVWGPYADNDPEMIPAVAMLIRRVN